MISDKQTSKINKLLSEEDEPSVKFESQSEMMNEEADKNNSSSFMEYSKAHSSQEFVVNYKPPPMNGRLTSMEL